MTIELEGTMVMMLKMVSNVRGGDGDDDIDRYDPEKPGKVELHFELWPRKLSTTA